MCVRVQNAFSVSALPQPRWWMPGIAWRPDLSHYPVDAVEAAFPNLRAFYGILPQPKNHLNIALDKSGSELLFTCFGLCPIFFKDT
jgi:hypothetical protein